MYTGMETALEAKPESEEVDLRIADLVSPGSSSEIESARVSDGASELTLAATAYDPSSAKPADIITVALIGLGSFVPLSGFFTLLAGGGGDSTLAISLVSLAAPAAGVAMAFRGRLGRLGKSIGGALGGSSKGALNQSEIQAAE